MAQQHANLAETEGASLPWGTDPAAPWGQARHAGCGTTCGARARAASCCRSAAARTRQQWPP